MNQCATCNQAIIASAGAEWTLINGALSWEAVDYRCPHCGASWVGEPPRKDGPA